MRSQHMHRGFTLTELMIALVVSSVVVTGMYGAFVRQQQIATQQEQTTEARQNARLTMDIMTQEIRAAGFDPGGLAGAGIVTADATQLRFTRDLNCNGTLARPRGEYTKGVQDPPQDRETSDEDVIYSFNASQQVLQRGVFVRTDNSVPASPAGGHQPVANNILALNFCYFLADDLAGPCIPNPAPDALDDLRAVRITLTARASAPDPRYTDPDPTQPPAYRHYHKATLTSLVHFRNFGVNRGGRVVDLDDPCPLPRQ